MDSISLLPGKRAYFASDFHLGAAPEEESRHRELRVVSWLEQVRSDAQVIFLLGDMFDFWFEYRKVVPRGFLRFQGKLAELADQGIRIVLFRGNHDMWMFNYFPEEIGAEIYSDPISLAMGNHVFHIGHGDGLGPGDKSYKLLRKIFRNRLAIGLFRWLPPVLGMGIAHRWSAHSRLSHGESEKFQGKEKEFLYQYCVTREKEEHHDFYIFGHRHLALDIPVGENARYINLGEWVTGSRYAVYDGEELTLKDFDQ